MKNSFFSRFTPKEPKFFPLLKQLSEVLCEASVVLTESLQHDSPTERADYYKKIKEQDAYAYGMVVTINDRMKQLYKMRQEVMTSDCRDLVVVKTDAVKKCVHEQFPNLRRGRSFRVTDTGALSHGRKDGHDVNLNRPVGYEHTPKPRLSRGH